MLATEMEKGEIGQALAFAIFKDEFELLAVSTAEAVYLIDVQPDEMKFCMRIPTPNVVFLAQSDQYMIMMASSDQDESEAFLYCHILFGPEQGSLSIKRFMGQ